jgi:amino acid adenylation domain-containing protein
MTTGSDCSHSGDGHGYPGDTLTQRFADAVRRWARRAAVSDDATTLTYEELDAKSLSLAATLADAGVRREDRVVVFLPRGVDLAVALLAVLRCGGCYVAVDAQYPPERRDLMIRMTGASVIISGGALLDTAREHYGDQLTVIDGTGIDTGIRRYSRPSPASDDVGALTVWPEDAASLLFTSGSTGMPKCVVVEHRNLVFFATNPGLPAIGPGDRVGQISSVSFDAFHYEFWVTLLSGGELVSLPTAPDLAALGLLREVARRQITAMLVPTMLFNHMACEEPEAFTGLRVLLVGGDVISPAACRAVLEGAFRGQLVNLYGPTEITTACTAFVISHADVTSDIPIGTPLPGTSIDLLPDGTGLDTEVGEILVSGPGVTRGYLDQPDLTAERFVQLPGVAGRAYRTGDRARRRADGALMFLGRIDDQVKIRGYRVEPLEVEKVLREHPDVQDAAMLVRGTGEDRYLLAAVVTARNVAPQDLIAFAAERLPHFMVPQTVVCVSSIPATSHGKRDLGLLDVTLQEALASIGEAAHELAPAQAVLAELWCDLLGVESVGLDDDFLGLGGHSLLAVRLSKRIEKRLGARISPADVIRTTRFRDMARLVDDALRELGG